MADNQKIKDLDNQYKEVLKTVEQIRSEEEKLIEAGKKLSAQKQRALKIAERELENISERIRSEKERVSIEKELQKVARSNAKLSLQVRKELQLTTNHASIYKSLSTELATIKGKQVTLEGESLAKSQQQETIVSSIISDMETQAKQVERAIRGENEREQFEQSRRDVKANIGILDEQQIKDLLDAIDYTEQLYNKEQRILQIKESQKNIFTSLPSSIQGAVNTAQSLLKTLVKGGLAIAVIAGLALAIGSAVNLFIELDEAAEKFREETGVAVSQMADLQKQAQDVRNEFADLGVEASDFYDTIAASQKEFGSVLRTTDTTNKALVVLNKNYGAGNDELAKSLGLFQNIAGLSEQTAANVLLQTSELSTNAGVSFAKIAADIAESAETSNDFFRGNVQQLVKQAIEARRLGTNLAQVLKTTESLLDFESSIDKELQAAAFSGGRFNLERARALAFAGEESEMMKEIVKQVQRSGDFTTKNLYERRAIAEAVGMEASEIDKLIGQQNRLNSLSDEQRRNAETLLDQGIDIGNISDDQLSKEVELAAQRKEQQGQLTNIKNLFSAIGTSLGTAFLPLLQTAATVVEQIARPFRFIGQVLESINESLFLSIGFYGTLLGLATRRYLIENATNIQRAIGNARAAIALSIEELRTNKSTRNAIANIYSAFFGGAAALGPLGAILAGGLAISVVGGLLSTLSTADDAVFPGGPAGYGKKALLQEGELTLFNNRDTVIAGTNLGGSNAGPGNSMDLVNEIRAMRREFGKTRDVYVDGAKVTSRIGRVVDETTRNNFKLA